jgi:hypothetical protein
MSLTTAEKFLVLAHHPTKPKYAIPEQMRNTGLIGAILMDLSAEERIVIEGGRIKVRSTNSHLPEPHRVILKKIQETSKLKKVKTWISRFSQLPGKYRKAIQVELERKAIMRIERKRFLFFPYLQTTLIKTSLREQMIRELRGIIFGNQKPDKETSMLLGLVQACRMHKVICKDRMEMKACKVKLKEIIESDVISGGVDKVIREMHAAVIGAVVASTAATTAAAH